MRGIPPNKVLIFWNRRDTSRWCVTKWVCLFFQAPFKNHQHGEEICTFAH